MAVATITAQFMKDLVPPEKRYKIHDDRIRGLMAEVRPSTGSSGATNGTFWFRYFTARHHERHINLGRFGEVPISRVRKRAEELRAEVALGGDPVGDKDKRLAVPTVAAFLRDTVLPIIGEQRGAYNWVVYARRIIERLGDKALDEVTVQDVMEFRQWLISLKLQAGTTNRHLAALRRAFSAAIKLGVISGRNPAAAPGMLFEQHREHSLSDDEVRALLDALQSEPNRHMAAAIGLLALTGARRNEILKLTWETQSNLKNGYLTIARGKNDRPRHIPLSKAAMRIVAAQHRRTGGVGHMFPGREPGKSLPGVRSAWNRVKQKAHLPCKTRLHDLRHTVASILVNKGVQLSEVATILGHEQLSTTRRYSHYSSERLLESISIASDTWVINQTGENFIDRANDENEAAQALTQASAMANKGEPQ